MHLSDIAVRHRLAGLVATFAVVVISIAGSSWVQVARVTALTAELGSTALPGVQLALETRLHVTSYRAAELRLLSEPNNRAAVLDELAVQRRAVEAAQAPLSALLSSVDERAALASFSVAWKEYIGLSERAVALTASSGWDDAWTLLTDRSQRLHESMSALLGSLSTMKMAHADASVAQAEHGRSQSLLILWGGTAAGLLAAAALAAWITCSITRPLGRALQVATAIAAGDLSGSIDSDARDEVGTLLRRLHLMQASLRTLVGSVRDSANDIGATSTQIAAGSHDLRARTEQQTGNVQETASSIEQLTTTVAANADVAQQAHQQAGEASAVAEQGGTAVKSVIVTMDEISVASRKIVEIVDLINGIAFQTNILALNAAVEAARAGAEGRGFAVVAAEVRSLALRTSAAAQEIAVLIRVSVEKIQAGSDKVGTAGTTMEQIVSQVQQVSMLIGQISSASFEQSHGIAGVNQAISQIDQMTKRNATLVEQSEASSESLRGQAARLADMVAGFRLEPTSVRR